MRFARLLGTLGLASVTITAAACGGDDGPAQPDARPASVTKANVNNQEVGNADWSCLGTPSDDVPTAVAITLNGEIRDFRTPTTKVRSATVTAFRGIDHTTAAATFGPTSNEGTYTLTLPTGTARWGFKVSAPDYMDTFLLNQYFDPNNANQSLNISAISSGLATALPAIIGLTREPGTGVLAGAMRDCQDREVSYAEATVSGTRGQRSPLSGAVTYYIDAGAGLPVRHDQLNQTDVNGLFAVFQLPPTTEAYIQLWGFVDEADLADGQMTLLAELPSPVVADTVITGSIEPLRTN